MFVTSKEELLLGIGTIYPQAKNFVYLDRSITLSKRQRSMKGENERSNRQKCAHDEVLLWNLKGTTDAETVEAAFFAASKLYPLHGAVRL